jgi:hypothetical protein
MSNNAQPRPRCHFGDLLWPVRSGWSFLPRLRLLGCRIRPLFFASRPPAGQGWVWVGVRVFWIRNFPFSIFVFFDFVLLIKTIFIDRGPAYN